MTRRIIGFVLDSFLLFLVALFIYGLGRRAGKKRANEVRIHVGGRPYPSGGILRRADGRIVGETQYPSIGIVPTSIPCDTGGDETTEIENLGGGAFRKGNEIWYGGEPVGVGTSMSGSGRHVPGADVPGLPHEKLFDNKEKAIDRREEEEDDYYDERE